MTNKLKTNPVMIEWIDSMGKSGWGEPKEPANLNCVTIGHLLSKTKDRVTIALNLCHYGPGDIMEIPLIAVKRIKRLKI